MKKELQNSSIGLDIQSSMILKGALSLLIVFHHLQYSDGLSYLNVFKHIGAPVVSIFFFLSGYGLMLSYKKKGLLYLNGFWRKRIGSILFPFIVVTLLYLFLDYLDKGLINYNFFNDLIFRGITPLPYSWFVFTIILLYAVFYAVFHINWLNIKWKISLLIIVTFFYIFFTKSVLVYDRAWWVSVLGFPSGILYVYYQEEIAVRLKGISRKFLGIIFLLGVCACLIITKSEWLYLFVYALIPVITLLLISCFDVPKFKSLIFLGDISYEIYLVHGACIVLLRGEHIYIRSGALYIIIVFLITIVTSFFLKSFLSTKKNNSHENTSNR